MTGQDQFQQISEAVARFNAEFAKLSKALRWVCSTWVDTADRIAYMIRHLPPQARWQIGMSMRPTMALPRRSARRWRRQ